MVNTIKRIITFVIVTALMIAGMAVSVNAAELQDVTVEYEANVLTIEGKTPAGSGAWVTIKVKNRTAATPFYIGGTEAGANGAFSFAIELNSSGLSQDASGMYDITVGGAGVTAHPDDMFFINDNDSVSILPYINSIPLRETLISNIGIVKGECGIDPAVDMVNLSSDGKNSVYDGLLNRTHDSVLAFREAYYQAIAIATLNEGNPVNGDTLIGTYGTVLDLECGEGSYFAGLTDKSTVYSSVIGGSFNTRDVAAYQTAFNKAVYLTLVNSVTTANRSKYIDYIAECIALGYTTISLADYNSDQLRDTDRIDILSDIVSYKTRNPFGSLEAFFTYFTNKVNQTIIARAEQNNQQSSGFGGGGGGGYSGPSITVDNDYVEEIKKEEPEVVVPPVVTPAVSFDDIDSVPWAQKAIEEMAAKNILSGVGNGKFEPDRAVTREEFVKIVLTAFDVPEEETSGTFADVEEGAWYYEYVMNALAGGLVNGVDYENFGVGQSITRQQLCTIVYRAMNLMDIYLTPERTEVPFEDFDSVSPYAKEAVEALYKAGVINGVSETEFDAEGEATRAMAAKIVYEILERGQDK